MIRASLVLAFTLGATLFAKAAPPSADYRLVWADEFDGKTLDPAKWVHRAPGKRVQGINVRDSVSLNGAGHLLITVKQVDGKYHTGMIGTDGKFAAKYGYFECRAQMHKGPGFWSAFWLQSKKVSDPDKGKGAPDDTRNNGTEIDILEYLPGRGDGFQHALHWNGYGKLHKQKSKGGSVPGLRDGWHTFALDWRPDGYTFYVDGKKTWETAEAISGTEQFVILSVEVGPWAGDIKQAQLRESVSFDYVRVYQKKVP